MASGIVWDDVALYFGKDSFPHLSLGFGYILNQIENGSIVCNNKQS